MTIVAFVLARIQEDEDEARYPTAEEWVANLPTLHKGVRRHVRRWDPARALAECEAKRAIVEAHMLTTRAGEEFCSVCGPHESELYLYAPGTKHWPCFTLCTLAAVYADNPE